MWWSRQGWRWSNLFCFDAGLVLVSKVSHMCLKRIVLSDLGLGTACGPTPQGQTAGEKAKEAATLRLSILTVYLISCNRVALTKSYAVLSLIRKFLNCWFLEQLCYRKVALKRLIESPTNLASLLRSRVSYALPWKLLYKVVTDVWLQKEY